MYTALIIEDDKAVQLYLKRILELKFQFKVCQAMNGLEGLKVLEENKVDLIFLDHSMPVMDGYEFLKIFRKEEKNNHIPVFVVTTTNDPQIIKEMIELGVDDYILKPFNPETTYKRVLKVLVNKKKS